jgi:hypothetical protein
MNSLSFLRNAGANSPPVATTRSITVPWLSIFLATATLLLAWFVLKNRTTLRDTVESWFIVRNPREPIYWCYIGSEKAQRHCVRVPHKTLCEDGVAFATRNECEQQK